MTDLETDWVKIENAIKQNIPKNIKILLSVGGYDSLLAIKTIDNEKLNILQKYLQNLIKSDHQLLAKLDKSDKTSLVYSSQNSFTFLPGHASIILALPHYIAQSISNSIDFGNEIDLCEEPDEFSPLLSKLIESARKNRNENKNANRYEDTIKDFSTYIFLLCGRTCYETLHRNLPIPSIKTICKYKEGKHNL